MFINFQVKQLNIKISITIVWLLGSIFFSSVLYTHEIYAEAKKAEPLPLEELRIFAEVYNRIKSNYVEDVDDEALLNGAIAGMLDSLDPHSTFLNKEAYKNIQDSSAGQYGGLGIEVIPEKHSIKIISPIDNTPASRAGILPGDHIVKIDNTPLRNINAEDAMELMRGEVGEKVHLSIRREGENELLEMNLIREIIKLSSIQSKWLGNGIAYLRIAQFQNTTANDLTVAVQKLRDDHEVEITGAVLDLRNNPGGVLMAAKAVADQFIEQGVIVSTKGKASSANTQLSATAGDVLNGAPIVVLMNSGSASAAEIVAGALQDHKRAIIMGTLSFGKGSVQTLMPISNDAVLKLTTALYYTPNGISIQGIGIKPDIEVHQKTIVVQDNDSVKIYESDLKGALSNGSESTVNNEAQVEKIQKLLDRDYQLSEAFHLLRGINILSLKAVIESTLIKEL